MLIKYKLARINIFDKFTNMGKTTVDLTETARKIKEELMPIFGLKNILSAGLILLGRLSNDEKMAIITEAIGSADESKSAVRTARVEAIKKIVSTMTQPGYKILSSEESTALDELRKALGPEKKELSAKKAKNA
jgi:hypothetical protein